MPSEFVHYIEWRTPLPVTVRSFRLWANGDEDTLRECSSFRLLAKSAGSSTFDQTVSSFVPSHPYTNVQGVWTLLVSTDVTPTTAQDFRAEFVNHSLPYSAGPRVRELDGFSTFLGPEVDIRASEVEISWSSVSRLRYQVECLDDLPGSGWLAWGSPVVGTGGNMYVVDKILPGQTRRFYRVRPID
jgi:hypothetical protein